LINNIKLVQGTGEDDVQGGGRSGEDAQGKAAWLVELQKRVAKYYDHLPVELKTLQRAGSLVKNPLFRFLERETSVLSALLQTVRRDFQLVLEVCSGERKATSQLKALAETIHADVVPKHWKKYIVPDSMACSEWLTDFQQRVE
jgi:dynein heavy chain 1